MLEFPECSDPSTVANESDMIALTNQFNISSRVEDNATPDPTESVLKPTHMPVPIEPPPSVLRGGIRNASGPQVRQIGERYQRGGSHAGLQVHIRSSEPMQLLSLGSE